MDPGLLRKLIAEALGTFALVFFGVGSAVFGISVTGPWGVALTFGFVMVALVYAFGPISGCHLNPAITVGALLARRIDPLDAAWYAGAQVGGGIIGAMMIKVVVAWGNARDQTGVLGANDYGTHVNAGGAFLIEVLLTFLLVFVVLMVTGHAATPGLAGFTIGLALSAVYLVSLPLDGGGANPARSIGPALWAAHAPLAHLWLFIIAPLLGGSIAAAAAELLGYDTHQPTLTGEDEHLFYRDTARHRYRD
ncbi:MAG: MIP/aquaporin family protein [Mycobacteriales bacterium]